MPFPAILGAIAGPLIGGLLGGSGGGSQAGTTQTIQSQDPWSGQQPYLKRLYQSAMGTPGQDIYTPSAGFGNYTPASGGFGASGYDGWDGGGGYGGAYGQPAGTWSKGPATGGLQEQQYYPDSTVVPQSPETLQALDLQSQRALSGNPLQGMGNQQLGGTLQGQYLGAQPGAGYLQGFGSPTNLGMGGQTLQDTARGDYLYGGEGFNNAFNAARNTITPMVQGAFNSVGRYGGGLGQEAETGALADAFAGLYGQERGRQMGAAGQLAGMSMQDRMRAQQAAGQLSSQASNMFGQERQRQLAGMQFIPQMAGLDFQNIAALSNVGAQREQFGAQQMADQVDRWNFAQQAPYNLLNAQSQIVQGMNPGGTTTSTQPYFQNRAAGALGGALTGASIANQIDWGGMFGGGGVGDMSYNNPLNMPPV